jgi:peroxiredoxin
MKIKLLVVLIALLMSFSGQSGSGAETNDLKSELKDLVGKIQTKLREGKRTEADLADELKGFDELLARHQGEKNDDVAQAIFMKAMIYSQVLDNEAKANELTDQLKRDFPDSEPVAMLKQQEEGKKIQAGLVEGSKFPEFDEKDLNGKPLAISNFKGKLVLIDFWATWCGPCVAELPNVLKTYEQHHPAGFEVIGISLDDDETKLKTFIENKSMPWPQFFDGKGWSNKLAKKYGVMSIPATFLLDGEGKIIGRDLRGPELEDAVTKALPKK